jgi:serine/threonine protein kinase
MVYYCSLTFLHSLAGVEHLFMHDDTEVFVSKSEILKNLTLPDGTQPLPLGSGSIAALLGIGGMSNVYKIWNPQLEQHRAVKLMKPDLSPDSRQRFQTEIKITAALSHPNIIEIHSVGEWNTLSFIEMEFIDGATLSDIIDKHGALPIEVCVALGILMARALVYAHDKEYVLYGKTYHGLIHRDLKPSNIMIANDGRVKLMDFGIARPVETSLMTLDGEVMGTMQYLAPEQIDGKNVGVAADLFALGAILYETITGSKAFPQKNLSQLMSAKTANIFMPLRFCKQRIPKRLKYLVGKCMHLDPQKRHDSAVALLEALNTIYCDLTDESPELVITHFMQSESVKRIVYSFRRKLPAVSIAAAVTIALATGIGIGFMITRAIRVPEIAIAAAPPSTAIPEPAPTAARTLPESVIVTPITVDRSAKPRTHAAESGRVFASKAPAINKPSSPYLDALKSSTGLTDPLEIMAREATAGNHSGVLNIYRGLPPALANGITARILRLRALFALGKRVEVAQVFLEPAINDGEFYQLKARYLINKGEIGEALLFLDKSITVSAAQIDATVLRHDYLYYRALCLSRLFERSPAEEYRKNALGAWFEVKNSLRKNPDHAYFRRAVSEMQKIGSSAQPAKR